MTPRKISGIQPPGQRIRLTPSYASFMPDQIFPIAILRIGDRSSGLPQEVVMVTYETLLRRSEPIRRATPQSRRDGGARRDLLHTFVLLVLLASIVGFRAWLNMPH
ncbi:hypothetical protein J2Y55_002239 [Bosea sp. BE125]|uniref:hypothetical protein n=1 Tax=Bosea sp. BE125 TaxID=2817909 RepID=UPI0028636E96|nr:hypothetical protein [Bosea sp. BE125]MDR6871227.1 hypothetical protein [Bosea sp. BE125]